MTSSRDHAKRHYEEKRKPQIDAWRKAGLCVACGEPVESGTRRCLKHLEMQRRTLRKRLLRLKTEVFNHYGNKCQCCGEKEPAFLTIDHVDGIKNKADDKYRGSKRSGGSTAWYREIIKRGFPNDLQLLCWNCNSAKHFLGTCPHKNAEDCTLDNG